MVSDIQEIKLRLHDKYITSINLFVDTIDRSESNPDGTMTVYWEKEMPNGKVVPQETICSEMSFY